MATVTKELTPARHKKTPKRFLSNAAQQILIYGVLLL
jgi:hypothetical protein